MSSLAALFGGPILLSKVAQRLDGVSGQWYRFRLARGLVSEDMSRRVLASWMRRRAHCVALQEDHRACQRLFEPVDAQFVISYSYATTPFLVALGQSGWEYRNGAYSQTALLAFLPPDL